jgi:hypothetical protein
MSDVFTQSGSTFTPTAANGSSLVALGSGNYLYTAGAAPRTTSCSVTTRIPT